MIKFPSNFLWGAATSSYQVEGNNSNADWWPWELKVGHAPSGSACRHYDLYEADFDLLKNMNHNAHRLSIEWSRIEPKEGVFDEKEIAHYVAVIKALRARAIEPIVTLHHFTSPIWLAEKGGWENPAVINYFDRYSARMVEALKNDVYYWNTINEPTIYTSHSFWFGWWPPQKKDFWSLVKAHNNMVDAHIKVYRTIKRIYKASNIKEPMVSIAHHMQDFILCRDTWLNRLAVKLRYKWLNFEFLDRIARAGTMDFIGFNFYSRQIVDVKGFGLHNIFGDVCKDGHFPVKKNSLGWDIYPEGIYQVLIKLKKYNVPIIISENGICTYDDTERWDFIVNHLNMIHKAMEEGVDVRGYLHWSLMDNFEWDKGYKPRFGLIDINYETHARTIKDSAKKYAEICKTGIVP